MTDEKKLTHAAKAPYGNTNWACECPHSGDHWIGPLDAEVLEQFANTPGGAERLSVSGEVFAVRAGNSGPWTCGVSSRIGCWPPADHATAQETWKRRMTDEKQLWCNACQLDVPLDQAKVVDIRTVEGERLFFAQTVHALCGSPVQEKENKIHVTELRPRGLRRTENLLESANVLASFTSGAYQAQVAQREEDLKTMVRNAIKLVEENPPNEPMRTPVSRPAVERMLAEDIAEALVPETVLAQDLAKKLFDAGWRPTIDRLVR